MKRLTFVVLCVLAVTALAGATGQTETEPEQEVTEYSVYFDSDEVYKWFDNPTDIVTPYFEDRFGLRISEVLWRSGQITEQRINTLIASNSFPDVFISSIPGLVGAESQAKDLTELVPEYMPYYWNQVLDEGGRQMSTTFDKVWYVYKVDENPLLPEFSDDPYNNNRRLVPLIREDILAKLGYSFTPIAEIEARCQAEGRAVTMEDLRIDPVPYETYEEFGEFLRDIQALGLTDPAGNDVMVTSMRWGIQVLGMGADFWQNWVWHPDAGTCSGYLGSPEAKYYVHWWWQLYRDGVVDPDYVIQQTSQLQEKIATGRVAVFLDVPDIEGAQQSLLGYDDSWYIRPIPFPRTQPDNVSEFPLTPGHYAAMINKRLDDDTTRRLLEMWDFMNTAEGIQIMCYGPPDAGLTTTNGDGRTVFTEPLMSRVLSREKDLPGGVEELGLRGLSETVHAYGMYWSQIANCSAAPRDAYGLAIDHSIPPNINGLFQATRLLTIDDGMVKTTRAHNASEAASAAGNYWNSTFKYNEIARILNAETEAEFEEAWAWAMQRNEEIGRYSEAVSDMTEYFAQYGWE